MLANLIALSDRQLGLHFFAIYTSRFPLREWIWRIQKKIFNDVPVDGSSTGISVVQPPSECFCRGADEGFVAILAISGGCTRPTATLTNGFDFSVAFPVL